MVGVWERGGGREGGISSERWWRVAVGRKEGLVAGGEREWRREGMSACVYVCVHVSVRWLESLNVS